MHCSLHDISYYTEHLPVGQSNVFITKINHLDINNETNTEINKILIDYLHILQLIISNIDVYNKYGPCV